MTQPIKWRHTHSLITCTAAMSKNRACDWLRFEMTLYIEGLHAFYRYLQCYRHAPPGHEPSRQHSYRRDSRGRQLDLLVYHYYDIMLISAVVLPITLPQFVYTLISMRLFHFNSFIAVYMRFSSQKYRKLPICWHMKYHRQCREQDEMMCYFLRWGQV